MAHFSKSLLFIIFIFIILISCQDKTTKNLRFIKNYRTDDSLLKATIPYKTTTEVYPYPCNNAGYEKAGLELKNPVSPTPDNLTRGKELFTGHCAHCHGLTGKSDAPMVLKNKFPPPPPYSVRLKTINDGKMFHSITCGKNLMPANKNELSSENRWQVIMYIKTLIK